MRSVLISPAGNEIAPKRQTRKKHLCLKMWGSGLVAQICNLLYRRFVIGRASESSSALALAAALQNEILRYSAARHCRNQSSADFQVCCVADFPIRRPSKLRRTADLEVGDTAGLETCATASVDAFRSRRTPCLLLNLKTAVEEKRSAVSSRKNFATGVGRSRFSGITPRFSRSAPTGQPPADDRAPECDAKSVSTALRALTAPQH